MDGRALGVICALVLNEPNLHGYLQSADRPQGRQRHYLLPHPGARQCSWKAIEIVKRAAEAAGAPEGCVDGITQLTLEATSELMHSKTCR